MVETQRQVIHDEPVSPSRLNTKVPRDLETICLKCLHKDPSRRYATAHELAEASRRAAGPAGERDPGGVEPGGHEVVVQLGRRAQDEGNKRQSARIKREDPRRAKCFH